MKPNATANKKFVPIQSGVLQRECAQRGAEGPIREGAGGVLALAVTLRLPRLVAALLPYTGRGSTGIAVSTIDGIKDGNR